MSSLPRSISRSTNSKIAGQLVVLGLIALFFTTSFPGAYGSHCINFDPTTETIALLCGEQDLFDISDSLGPNSVLREETDGVWVLSANMIVGNSATLNINSTYTSWLKIDSATSHNLPYHLSVLGNMNIDSVRVSSWDSVSQNFTKSDGSIPRPYITILPHATGRSKY